MIEPFKSLLENSSTQVSKILTSIPHCKVSSCRIPTTRPEDAAWPPLLNQLFELCDGQVWENQKHHFASTCHRPNEDRDDNDDDADHLPEAFARCLIELSTLGCPRLYTILNELGQLGDGKADDLLRTLASIVLSPDFSDKQPVTKMLIITDQNRRWAGLMDLCRFNRNEKHVDVKLDWDQQECGWY